MRINQMDSANCCHMWKDILLLHQSSELCSESSIFNAEGEAITSAHTVKKMLGGDRTRADIPSHAGACLAHLGLSFPCGNGGCVFNIDTVPRIFFWWSNWGRFCKGKKCWKGGSRQPWQEYPPVHLPHLSSTSAIPSPDNSKLSTCQDF